MSTLILVPVLNRPHRVAPLLDTLDGMDVMFIISPTDLDEHEAISRELRKGVSIEIADWDPGPGDYARKINMGVQQASWQDYGWVFTGADDLVFHDGWLDQALKVAAATGATVIGTNDLWNPAVRRGKHSTHSLVNVEYVMTHGATFDAEPGVLLHEGYDHQCVDNELVAVATMRGRFAFAKDSIVEHLHPFAKKAEMDDTYRKALAMGRNDIALFQVRRAQVRARVMREGRL